MAKPKFEPTIRLVCVVGFIRQTMVSRDCARQDKRTVNASNGTVEDAAKEIDGLLNSARAGA